MTDTSQQMLLFPAVAGGMPEVLDFASFVVERVCEEAKETVTVLEGVRFTSGQVVVHCPFTWRLEVYQRLEDFPLGSRHLRWL